MKAMPETPNKTAAKRIPFLMRVVMGPGFSRTVTIVDFGAVLPHGPKGLKPPLGIPLIASARIDVGR
jgi:hypothetical protein